MTLYELTAEYQNLLDLAADPEVDEQTFLDTLEGLSGEIEDKADGYARVIKTLEAEVAAIDIEIKRLSLQKSVRAASAERMRAKLKDSMELTGKTKFKTGLFSFGVRKTPPSVFLEARKLGDIPKKYLIPQDPKVDKAKIREDLKAGKDLSGIAHLEQGQHSVSNKRGRQS